jgi:hypothetical protein
MRHCRYRITLERRRAMSCKSGERVDQSKHRKRMMDDWSKYCGNVADTGKVLAMNRRTK